MTRLAPTLPVGHLEEGDYDVYNCWLIPGDTPDAVRVYTNPNNVSMHEDIFDLTQQCYRWTNLPSGSLMSFSVSCLYSDGEEKSGSFYAKTTGPPATSGGGASQTTISPPLQNISVHVEPYLRGVVIEWDALETVGQVEVAYAAHNSGWMPLGDVYHDDQQPQPQHMTFVITPEGHLQYGVAFKVRLTQPRVHLAPGPKPSSSPASTYLRTHASTMIHSTRIDQSLWAIR